MDISTIAGIVAGIAFIIVGIIIDGSLQSFYDLPSIMIVLGGTLAAIMVSYPLRRLAGFTKVANKLFFSSEERPREIISRIIELANIARKEGLLALEEAAYGTDDPFLQKGILLIVDGTDPELVRNILETELDFVEERHREGQGIFETMASLSPAFGMIGTLIGLINMLKQLQDPSSLGPSMSVALVTTFYGSMLANLFFTPMAIKLKYKSTREILLKEIMLEGMLSIQAGENPRIIEEKLKAFLPPRDRTDEGGNPPEEDE
ncbi:MAG TPA: MotA/TolQ/ExbB proton channel family protein [Clostridia bacterium]|nr:MotA/TolQ/ExbB proton channel family protein [Clostridia bacterium]